MRFARKSIHRKSSFLKMHKDIFAFDLRFYDSKNMYVCFIQLLVLVGKNSFLPLKDNYIKDAVSCGPLL